MKAWLAFSSVGPIEGPPQNVNITVPSTVTCGTTVSLTGTGSDIDNDIVSVRWEVDGVLLADHITQLAINEAHLLRATLKDARGATTVDTQVVTCTL